MSRTAKLGNHQAVYSAHAGEEPRRLHTAQGRGRGVLEKETHEAQVPAPVGTEQARTTRVFRCQEAGTWKTSVHLGKEADVRGVPAQVETLPHVPV